MKQLFFAGLISLHLMANGTSMPNSENISANSLRNVLNPDGSVNYNDLTEGTFDATGFTLMLGANNAPLFMEEVPADSLWQSPFGTGIKRVFYGTVHTVCISYKNVYVGGNFTNAGDIKEADRIVKWNGSSWEALGMGIQDGSVYSIVNYNGYICVGGSFSAAGGVSNTSYIALWSEYDQSWKSLTNKTLNGNVLDILPLGSDLYAAGTFKDAGGVVGASGVARYDDFAGAWQALGTGIVNGGVSKLEFDGLNIYAAGGFTDAGGVANADYIAKWNFTTWSGLSTGLNNRANCMYVLDASNIYVGGSFTTAGGVSAKYIAKWNGSAWSALGAGPSNVVQAVVAAYGNVYAGSYAGISKWNGTSWLSLDGSSLPKDIWTLSLSGADLLVGGSFTDVGGIQGNSGLAVYRERDAYQYNSLGGLSIGGDINTFSYHNNKLYIGGSFSNLDGNPDADYVACWNGKTWEAVGNGLLGPVFVLKFIGDTLYAGDDWELACWKGGQWEILKVTSAPVRAIDTFQNRIFIGGNFMGYIGSCAWDGSDWAIAGGGANAPVYSLKTYKDKLFVGGVFTKVNNLNYPYLAEWNGWGWDYIPFFNGPINCLDANDKYLYVGGGFSTVGSCIARWDGTSWDNMGGGTNYEVKDIFIKDTNMLYISGVFTSAGGTPLTEGIAGWNGSAWLSLAQGINRSGSSVNAIFVDNNGKIYAGGDFSPQGQDINTKNLCEIIYTSQPQGTWSIFGQSGVNANTSSCITENTIGFGGSFPSYYTNKTATGLIVWNGSYFSSLGGSIDGEVYITYRDGEDLYAGGAFTSVNGSVIRNITKWNGAIWEPLGVGTDATVYAICKYNNEIYAGGDFKNTSVKSEAIGAWNGVSWRALPFILSGKVNTLAEDGKLLYIGGKFICPADTTIHNIAVWDGKKLSSLGIGLNNDINTIVVLNHQVFAGGNFTLADGSEKGNYIARWNGSAWSSVGDGFNGPVYSLAKYGNSVYAGGNFTKTDTSTVNHIALWDETGWHSLGSGTDNSVYGIATSSSSAYVTGSFGNAGGKTAQRMAQWNGLHPYIVSQTHDTIIDLGASIELKCELSGSQPMKVVWKKDGIVLPFNTPAIIIDSMMYSDAGQYVMSAVNAVGCISSDTIKLSPGLPSPSICMVSVDTASGMNKIIWEKNEKYPVSKYMIYQEIGKDLYVQIGEKKKSELSVFTDSFADPLKQSYSYKITAVDSSGQYESDISKCIAHRTMNLIVTSLYGSTGIGLQWNAYQGFDFSSYVVLRSVNGGNFDSLTSIPAGYFYNSFKDNNPPSKTVSYFVKVNSPMVCDPAELLKADSGPYAQSLSNIVEFKTTATNQTNSLPISIYPNPFTETITIELFLENTSDVMIEVINALGQKTAEFSYKGVMAGSSQMVLNAEAMNISEGICYLKVVANEKTSVVKCNLIK